MCVKTVLQFRTLFCLGSVNIVYKCGWGLKYNKEWTKMLKYPLAVTIDTNVFDAAKYDFSENSTLHLLENYVKSGKVKVVLSNIVIR